MDQGLELPSTLRYHQTVKTRQSKEEEAAVGSGVHKTRYTHGHPRGAVRNFAFDQGPGTHPFSHQTGTNTGRDACRFCLAQRQGGEARACPRWLADCRRLLGPGGGGVSR